EHHSGCKRRDSYRPMAHILLLAGNPHRVRLFGPHGNEHRIAARPAIGDVSRASPSHRTRVFPGSAIYVGRHRKHPMSTEGSATRRRPAAGVGGFSFTPTRPG